MNRESFLDEIKQWFEEYKPSYEKMPEFWQFGKFVHVNCDNRDCNQLQKLFNFKGYKVYSAVVIPFYNGPYSTFCIEKL